MISTSPTFPENKIKENSVGVSFRKIKISLTSVTKGRPYDQIEGGI